MADRGPYVEPLEVPLTGSLEPVLDALRAAVAGDGPARVVVPERGGEAVLAAARVDEPLEAGAAGPVALVVATSGSTGAPKAALLPASALQHSAAAAYARLGGPGQWLLALPLSAIGGLSVLVRSALAGTTPVRMTARPFTAAEFAAATARLTGPRRYTALVPTQVYRLAESAEGLAALAAYDGVLVGAAPLPDDLGECVAAAGVRLVRTYGMTETCGGCVYDGLPLDDVLVRADPGRPIELGGPVVFAGYRLQPELTAAALRAEDGVRWHVTADTGALDADGRLEVFGRVDDMIITGGTNVAPWAVERALLELAGVRAASVVGVPDPEWGELVVALVVSDRDLSLAVVRDHLRGRVPDAALPRRLVRVAELPLLTNGKPDRGALRTLAAPGPQLR